MTRAEKTTTAFRLRCSIRRDIVASPERIWRLLTDAARFPSWNSTVTSIDGEIALGRKLALKVPLDPKRTFHPKVTRLVANREMEWRDGFAPMFRGVRTFALTPGATGVTTFEMTETFPGLMLPMAYFMLLGFADGRVQTIRDFRYVPYIAAEAELVEL